jgi:hypothetical protein
MNDWLESFQMMGAKLNEGEKSLMRFAMSKERERIIKLLEQHYLETQIQADIRGQIITQSYSVDLIALIKGENK